MKIKKTLKKVFFIVDKLKKIIIIIIVREKTKMIKTLIGTTNLGALLMVFGIALIVLGAMEISEMIKKIFQKSIDE